jgi:hypothetical protein
MMSSNSSKAALKNAAIYNDIEFAARQRRSRRATAILAVDPVHGRDALATKTSRREAVSPRD